MKKYLTPIIGILTLLALVSCSSVESRSQKLQLGMARAAAIKTLDSDYTIVAARVDADGSSITVLNFPIKKKNGLYLYFRNDKLAQWGDIGVLDAMPPGSAK
ncbi:MAG: hypothetical protein WBN75_07700 [Verrucomicrobiia bacterium]|jgi:hypothetical protein